MSAIIVAPLFLFAAANAVAVLRVELQIDIPGVFSLDLVPDLPCPARTTPPAIRVANHVYRVAASVRALGVHTVEEAPVASLP